MTQASSDGPLLTVGDIAALAGVRPNVVSNWRKRAATGTARGAAAFPSPDPAYSGKGRPVFRYGEVRAWLEAHGKRVGEISADVRLWSASLQSLGDLSPADAMEALLAVAAARRLSRRGADEAWPLLERAAQAEAPWDDAASVLARLGPEELTSWPEAARAKHRDRPLSPLLEAVGGLSDEQLPEVTDAYLKRLDGQLGRQEAAFGSVGSVSAAVLGRLTAGEGPRTLLDPVAGTGGALTEALRWGASPETIVAADREQQALRVTQRRLFLRGRSARTARVELPDGEGSERLAGLRCDVVVAEPPFSDAFDLFGFLALVPERLARSGTGFVLTRAAALDDHATEAARLALLRSGSLTAVVALPARLLRHSPMPLAVWVLRRPDDAAVSEEQRVLLVDATDCPPDGLAEEVARRLADRGDDHSRAVAVSAVTDAGGNLDPTAWVRGGPSQPDARGLAEDPGALLLRESRALATADLGVRPTRNPTLRELADAGVVSLPPGRPTPGRAGDVFLQVADSVTAHVGDAESRPGPVWVRVDRPDELDPAYLALAVRVNRTGPVRDVRHQLRLVPRLRVPMLPADQQRAFVEQHRRAERLATLAQAMADALVDALGTGVREGDGGG